MLALLAYQATLTLALTPSTSLRPALVAAAPRSARVATCSMAASEEDSTDYSTDWDSAWRTELRRREQGLVTWRPEGMEPVSTEVLLKARAATATSAKLGWVLNCWPAIVIATARGTPVGVIAMGSRN